MKDNIELKPCPFCGCDSDGCAEFKINSDGVIWCVIRCRGCQAEMVESAFNKDGELTAAFRDGDTWYFFIDDILKVQRAAAAAWNRRAK